MIFKLAWLDFESLIKTVFSNPGNEGTTIVQPILTYYEREESIDLYIPLHNVIYCSRLSITDFGEGMRFETVEAFKLEVLKQYRALNLTEDPKESYKTQVVLRVDEQQ